MNQILASDIKNDHVYISEDCTFCNEYKYQSFRRDHESAGRMYAIIGWEK